MKKKMCRWIFKKELNEAYTELNNSYCREVRRVEAAMEHNEKKYGLMKRIFSLLPTAEIIEFDFLRDNIRTIQNSGIYG